MTFCPAKSPSVSHEYIHRGTSKMPHLVNTVFDITLNAINSFTVLE